MRLRLILLALMCGLLAACSDPLPSPATPRPSPSVPSPIANSPLATPSPVISPVVSTDSTSTPSVPDNPAPESTIEPPGQVISTPTSVADNPAPESTIEPTLQVIATPSETLASPATPVVIPAGPLTIVALGDSLTEGDGDYPGDGGGYPARLQKSFNGARPNSQVINLGKSGWDSGQMVDGQLPSALQANPNIALVWIGSNDLWYNNGPDQEASDLARYTNNIDKTLRSLTGKGARVYIALLDDQSKRPYATSPNGIGLDAAGVAYMSKLGGDFNDAIRAKAAEYGATTVDFYNTKIFTDLSTLADDGLHPNPHGYDLVAQIWFEAIRQDLQ